MAFFKTVFCRRGLNVPFLLHSNEKKINSLSCGSMQILRTLKSDASEETFEYEEIDDSASKEEEIQRKRNKSRLKPAHYNVLHGVPPYDEPKEWYHETVRYKRRMYGRYGEKSGVNPVILWPTRQELEEELEYERVAYPKTLQELMKEAKLQKEQEERELQEQQKSIHERVLKLDQWKKELEDKKNKKLMEAQAAKEKKDRLIEEVRRYFGYTVDTKDERFIQMVEQKEKEEKKAQKEAKKKAREAKLLAYLVKQSVEAGQVSADNTEETKSAKEMKNTSESVDLSSVPNTVSSDNTSDKSDKK